VLFRIYPFVCGWRETFRNGLCNTLPVLRIAALLEPVSSPARTLNDVTPSLRPGSPENRRSLATRTICPASRRARDHGHAGLALSPFLPFANHAPPRMGPEGGALLLQHHYLFSAALCIWPDLVGRMGRGWHRLRAVQKCLDRCVSPILFPK
jgi:hypothetical protein